MGFRYFQQKYMVLEIQYLCFIEYAMENIPLDNIKKSFQNQNHFLEPKMETVDKKGDEDDVFGQRSSTSSVEGTPTSPPAKKPSKVMVPLPGFGGPKVSVDTM